MVHAPKVDRYQAKRLVDRIATAHLQEVKRSRMLSGALKRLIGIWSDPAHSFVELIQNADDVPATSVTFQFFKGGVQFVHDGRAFNEKEIEAICSIDATTKDANTHTGFMGIGFKSTFRLSGSPHIFSAPYQFKFSPEGFGEDDWGWVLIPRWLDELPEPFNQLNQAVTAFWLPYQDDMTATERNRLASILLTVFHPLGLLFLRKVGHMTVIKGDTRRVLSVQTRGTVVEELLRGKKRTVRQYKYILISKNYKVPKKAKSHYLVRDSGRDKAIVRDVKLAFALTGEGDFASLEGPSFFVYLPTEFDSRLPFAIQGDFIMDSPRKALDAGIHWNRWMLRCASKVLMKAINEFKRDAKLRYIFYKILPTLGEEDTSYPEIIEEEVVKPFIKWASRAEIVINSKNHWVSADRAVIGSGELQYLLDKEKLIDLCGRDSFVNGKVEGQRFLRAIGVVDLNDTILIDALNDGKWVRSRPRAWFKKLYGLLAYHLYGDTEPWPSRFSHESRLRDLSIVLTESGDVVQPERAIFPPRFQKDRQLCRGIPGIHIVNRDVLNKENRKCLENLGVNRHEKEGIVRAILRGFEDESWRSWTEESLNRSRGFIKTWLKDVKWQPPQEFIQRLGCVRILDERGKLRRADHCYVPDLKLKTLFKKASFVAINSEEERHFYLALGVRDKPTVLLQARDVNLFPEPEDARLREYRSWLQGKSGYDAGRGSEEVARLLVIDGWNKIHWTLKRSKIVLGYLISNWQYYQQYVTSAYYYEHRGRRSSNIPSLLSMRLKSTRWLPTSKGLQVPSSNIFVPTSEIKEVARKLPPYVMKPEIRNDEDWISNGQPLFDFLGLTRELDISSMVYLLRQAASCEVTDALKSILALIYRHMGWILSGAVYSAELPTGLPVLTESQGFMPANSESLYWPDDYELATTVKNIGGIYLAWMPPIERSYLQRLFRELGVERLSDHCVRKLARPDQLKTSSTFTTWFNQRAMYIFSYVKHHRNDAPDRLYRVLEQTKVKVAPKVEGLIEIDHLSIATEIGALLDLESRRLFIREKPVLLDIAIELARNLRLELSQSSELEAILRERDFQSLESRLERIGISIITPQKTKIGKVKPTYAPSETEELEPEQQPYIDLTTAEVSTTGPSIIESTKDKIITEVADILGTREDIEIVSEMEDEESIARRAASILREIAGPKMREGPDIYRHPLESQEVMKSPSVVIKRMGEISAKFHVVRQTISNEEVYVTPGMSLVNVKRIRKLKNIVQKAVSVMGGNPDCVKICITKLETDGRNIEGQLYFNAARNDSPYRWVVVAARELARNDSRSNFWYGHVKVMTALLEKAIEHIREILPR